MIPKCVNVKARTNSVSTNKVIEKAKVFWKQKGEEFHLKVIHIALTRKLNTTGLEIFYNNSRQKTSEIKHSLYFTE